MITSIPLLQSVRVASPCNADWNEMQAVEGERVHFCMGCGKNVYNLSAMSQSEAEGLLRRHEGRLCVRYYQRRDGTVLAGDCKVGAQMVRMALIRRSAVAAGLFTLMLSAMAGINRMDMNPAGTPGSPVSVAPQPIAGGISIKIEEPGQVWGALKTPEPAPEPVMGKIAIAPSPPHMMGQMALPLHQERTNIAAPESPNGYAMPSEKDVTDEAILKPRR